jgi:tetratricopeptide (TPR) repeat protein
LGYCPAKQSIRRHTLAAWLSFVLFATSATAIPTLKDEWTFFCSGKPVTKKLVTEMSEKADDGSGSYGGGIGILNYACVQRVLEQKSFVAAKAAFKKSGGKGKAPVENYRLSDSLIKKANDSLASDFKSKKKIPKNLYYYGLSLALSGNPMTVNVLDELMTKFPKGEFIHRASLTLGDYYLDKQDVPKATREFEPILKSGTGHIKAYTRYKSAWIEFALAFNQKDVNKQRVAISKFASLEQELADEEGQGEVLAELIGIDLLDLLTALGNVAEARKILRKVDAIDVFVDLLERMARAKVDQGDGVAAYSLFAQMINERPLDKDNIAIHSEMVRLSAQARNIPNLMTNLRVILMTYANPKSAWSKKQDEDDLPIAAKKAEDIVFEFATSLDQEGSKVNNPIFISASIELYQLFIKSFPKSSREYEAEFLLGQLMLQVNKFQISANMMRKLLQKYPKGKFGKDATDILITAAQKAFESDKNVYTLPEAGMAKRPIKVPDLRQLFADSLDLYVKLRPKTPDLATMYFTGATLYFDFGHYSEANIRYQKFIQVAPNNPSAVAAALRILFTSKTHLGDDNFAAAKTQIARFPQLRNHKDVSPYYIETKSAVPNGKKPPNDISVAKGKKPQSGDGNEDENENQEDSDNSDE